MLCRELMRTSVEVLSPHHTAQWAARKMRDANIGFLPVCDTAQKVLGTLTDRDIAVRLVAQGLPPTSPIDQIMTQEVVACRPDDPVEVAMDLMARNHKSRMLCTDNTGQLQGVISLSDIARAEGILSAAGTIREVSARESTASLH